MGQISLIGTEYNVFLQILMNVLKTEMVAHRHAPTQLVVTHAPASQVIDWEVMNIHVLVSLPITITVQQDVNTRQC